MKHTYRKQFYFLLFISFILGSFQIQAQRSGLGNWLIYFGNKKINTKWNWHHELQLRNYNAIGDLEQLLIRTGIGYNLTENNNNLLLGYGYIRSENYIPGTDDKTGTNEHRLFQQFITRQSIGRLGVMHRYRLEQRWIEKDFKSRFRYFLSLNMPLNKPGSADPFFYLSAYNEIFLNTKGTIFDRNRLYGALGYQVKKDLRFELGYMNQFFSSGGRDQVNVVCFFSY